jgi:DNA-binding response OmpR family regulator
MPEKAPGAAPKTRVLLVDDDDDSTDLLRMLLARRGFAVTTARSVATALDAAEAGTVDVLVSDIGLPDGTGYDLLLALRAARSIPAIALSGRDRDAKNEGDAAFDEYLGKPVAIEKLVAALQRVAGKPSGTSGA